MQRVDRAWTAAVITVVMVAAAAFGITSMLNAALLATMAMLLSGCLPIERAWRSLDWKTLVVLGSAVGLQSAVTGSGLSQKIAELELCGTIGGGNPRASLAVVLVGTLIMTNIITNAAAAAFMFPVALSMAQRLHVSFLPFVMILMVGASCAFINPAGFQTNLMVQEPGGTPSRTSRRWDCRLRWWSGSWLSLWRRWLTGSEIVGYLNINRTARKTGF